MKEQIVKGGFYYTIVNIFGQFLSIITNLVLAIFLLPEDFGTIALITSYIGLISLFTNVGFGSSIIQNKIISDEQLSSIFWLNLGLSLITFFLIILIIPLAQKIYEDKLIYSVIFWSSIPILVTPFYIIQNKLMEKNLQFTTLSKINLLSTFIGFSSCITFAYLNFGVFSLVAHSISSTIVKFVCIVTFYKWKPNLIFQLDSIREMIWFSFKIKLSNSILFLERNLDYLILGLFFSRTLLGYYVFAYNIMYSPIKKVTYIFNDLLFPAFSKISDSIEQIKKIYFKSINLIATLTFPTMAFLSFNSEIIVNQVFGTKWHDAIPLIKILCFAGAIQSVSQLGSLVFYSIGKPEKDTKIALIRIGLIFLAIYFGSHYGLLIVTVLLLIIQIISFFIMEYQLRKTLNFPTIFLLKQFANPLIILVCMTLIQLLIYQEKYQVFKFIMMSFVLISLSYLLNKRLIKDIYLALKAKT